VTRVRGVAHEIDDVVVAEKCCQRDSLMPESKVSSSSVHFRVISSEFTKVNSLAYINQPGSASSASDDSHRQDPA
jgi:hypothetical protein